MVSFRSPLTYHPIPNIACATIESGARRGILSQYFIPCDRAQLEAAGPVTVNLQVTPGFLVNTPSGAVVDAGTAKWQDSSTAPSWGRNTKEHGVEDFTETLREQFFAELASQSSSVTFVTAHRREQFRAAAA